ncbi:MAG TPA: hypothetical protein VLG38_00460 [Gammaproteobacteria bacterium]|nr:hypothetical protein [Gammaproteobacteria bacterium]
MQHFVKRLSISLAVTALPSVAFASLSAQDLQDILVHATSLLNPALRLLLAVSFVTGVWFVVKALLKFKSFAQPLTQTAQPGDFSGPMTYMLVGAVLIYIPTSTNVLSATFFGSVPSMFGAGGAPNVKSLGAASQLLGYASVTLESQWATLIDTVVYYMQFIGFLAFIRGWILIAHTQHGQHDQMTKGIVHVVGGILAINFLPLVNAVINTLSG